MFIEFNYKEEIIISYKFTIVLMKKIKQFVILFLLFVSTTSSIASSNFSSWGYQLQNYDLDDLRLSDYDILVLDYSKDGTDDEQFTSTEIETIRTGKEGRKILSYISIGEAEDYRFYWDPNWLESSPEWLDESNPAWPGNYKVKYWIAEWQEIIKVYLQKILDIGFDGIYLDIIDAYEFYENTVTNSDTLMIDFVEGISNFTRAQVSEFMIIPQNGETIVNDRYLQIVDGIAREEVYVIATNEKRDVDETIEIEGYLDQFLDVGKIVMVVDYASSEDLIEFATSSASAKGYLSLATDVDLDHLGPNLLTEDSTNFYFLGLAIIPIIAIYINRKQ
ncbi:MAG: hypothetical protein HeimC2_33310 [Candidatus Heimdallarchaeota archaeon LC_2]|nr:MAG: hypothetical protein HeimC2_34940 [Candidatus Heimdallarchaeota archaeon LC_2]OLS21499.1 MAG: hypothetical protein HeimC2_33310 [Candidatus Heimdallarchaeota archaeon LC_2]